MDSTYPKLPWYDWLHGHLAPTDGAVKMGLAVIVLVTVLLLWKGDAVARAAWFIYLVSP